MNIKQFLSDPFGSKRVAKLEAALRLYEKAADSSARTIDELQKQLQEKQRTINELQDNLRRMPANMAAEHTLRKVMHLLPERERLEAQGILDSKPLTNKPYPPRGPLPRLDDPL